jgi:hypothetical protein
VITLAVVISRQATTEITWTFVSIYEKSSKAPANLELLQIAGCAVQGGIDERVFCKWAEGIFEVATISRNLNQRIPDFSDN